MKSFTSNWRSIREYAIVSYFDFEKVVGLE